MKKSNTPKAMTKETPKSDYGQFLAEYANNRAKAWKYLSIGVPIWLAVLYGIYAMRSFIPYHDILIIIVFMSPPLVLNWLDIGTCAYYVRKFSVKGYSKGLLISHIGFIPWSRIDINSPKDGRPDTLYFWVHNAEKFKKRTMFKRDVEMEPDIVNAEYLKVFTGSEYPKMTVYAQINKHLHTMTPQEFYDKIKMFAPKKEVVPLTPEEQKQSDEWDDLSQKCDAILEKIEKEQGADAMYAWEDERDAIFEEKGLQAAEDWIREQGLYHLYK